VNEYVRSTVLSNKAEALLSVEPLYGSLCHLYLLLPSLNAASI
jgi:hypothetical protein